MPSAQQHQSDYIYRPEDPEQLHEQRRIANQTQLGGLSNRYQQLAMDQQEAKALTRVQILTPLSVFLNMGVMILCSSKLISPNLTAVSSRHKTYLTVHEYFIMVFWAVLYLLQIGFSIFIMLSRTPETKKAIVHGVGTRLALSNYLLMLWAVFWVLDRRLTFILGTVALGVIALLLFFNSIILSVKYSPSKRHPLDWLFVHVPVKMFLLVTIQYDLFQQLFMAIGWDLGHGPAALEKGLWPAFGIIAGVGVLSALWIFATDDFTWTISGLYLNVGLLFYKHFPIAGEHPRPAALTAAIILSMSLQAVAFVASSAWSRIKARQEGRIALPMSPAEEAAIIQAETERQARAQAGARKDTVTTLPGDEEEHIQTPASRSKVTRKLGNSSTTAGEASS